LDILTSRRDYPAQVRCPKKPGKPNYFDMWGIATSDAAKAQVAAYGNAVVPRAVYALGENQHKTGGLSSEFDSVTVLPIDGTTPWPLL
jgi:hypothetical protein